MAQGWAESTREITNYGRSINQFPSNIIKSIRQLERINKINSKYADKKCLQCTNEEMLPKYIYIYIYMQV